MASRPHHTIYSDWGTHFCCHCLPFLCRTVIYDQGTNISVWVLKKRYTQTTYNCRSKEKTHRIVSMCAAIVLAPFVFLNWPSIALIVLDTVAAACVRINMLKRNVSQLKKLSFGYRERCIHNSPVHFFLAGRVCD